MIRAAEHTAALSISAISELDLLISRIYLERGTSAHTSIMLRFRNSEQFHSGRKESANQFRARDWR